MPDIRTRAEIAHDTAIENLGILFKTITNDAERKAAATQKFNDVSNFMVSHLGKDPVLVKRELDEAFSTPQKMQRFFQMNRGYGLSG